MDPGGSKISSGNAFVWPQKCLRAVLHTDSVEEYSFKEDTSINSGHDLAK